MRRPIIIIISVIVIFLLLGTIATSMFSFGGTTFSSENRGLGYGGGGGGAPEVGIAPAAEEPAPAFDAVTTDKATDLYNADGSRQAVQERLVIENADLAIVVKDPKARMAELNKLANEFGGYVVSSNMYQTYTSSGTEVPEATIVIRVDSKRLDEALKKIKEGAVDIQYENRSGQDVTSAYVDLQSQLKAKEAAEKKLLEILDKAEKAEDVLAIYLQIQTVQTQIEQLKGQIKYYEESAALSSISVRLIAEEGTQPIEIGPWKPEGAAKDAVEDLVRFVQNFVEFLIRFVIFTLPSLILIAIPLFLVYLAGRAIFRRFNKSKVVVEEKEEKK
jgi:flagellar basal body-associated protein FliL